MHACTANNRCPRIFRNLAALAALGALALGMGACRDETTSCGPNPCAADGGNLVTDDAGATTPGDAASIDAPADVTPGDATPGDATPGEGMEAHAMDNAMGLGGDRLLPWPADQYMPVHASGERRVQLSAALIPPGFTPEILDGTGASRVTPMVTWLPGGIAPSSLPDAEDWGATLSPESSVRVIVLMPGKAPEPWPVMAEIDATARQPEEATLILRPHRPLPFGARVVVGLRTSLRTHACEVAPQSGDCRAHRPSAALARVLANTPQGGAEAAWVAYGREALMQAMPLLAPSVAELAQAWSFTVREAQEVVDPLVALQQRAARFVPERYTLEPPEYTEDRALVRGTVEVEWYLDANDRLVLDAEGQPVVQQLKSVPFLVTIPRSVRQTRPVVLFGHGFFSSIEESTWGNLFGGLERWEMAAVTVPFHGFSEPDFPKAAQALSGSTLEGLAGIIDLQRQSHAQFTMVHQFIAQKLAPALVLDFGQGPLQPLDGTSIHYLGISNGGTQGLVMMSTSPVLRRGALVVAGGGWSHMLQRAAQWTTLGRLFSRRFRSGAQLQVGMAMMQLMFDPVDSLNFVQHLTQDRLPHMPPEADVLLVEAVNDAQVANLVTRWVAGAASLPLITPSARPVWGVPTLPGVTSLENAPRQGFEMYDLGVADNPTGNLPPEENGVHAEVRLLDAYRAQMGAFLEHGRIVRTCEGTCEQQ